MLPGRAMNDMRISVSKTEKIPAQFTIDLQLNYFSNCYLQVFLFASSFVQQNIILFICIVFVLPSDSVNTKQYYNDTSVHSVELVYER